MKAATEITRIKLKDSFWMPIVQRNNDITVPACLMRCEETGRISNFVNVASVPQGKHEGRFYNDACLYKVMEGVANTLSHFPDKILEQYADGVIDKIVAAQQQDGYLCTYFQLVEPGNKWTDMCMHEMYSAGHMLEAGIAYLDATGKDKLYQSSVKFIHHIMDRFGKGKEVWVPGHQEIELALIKLYQRTGDKQYLDFAHWLIEQRGHGYSKGREYAMGFYDLKYNQDDKPFTQQRVVTGHAVRAMYLYIAATDYMREADYAEYLKPLMSIWDNIVHKNMYITGGIGSTKFNEGFTADYDLPNKTAYNETCASVGMVMWNHRLTKLFQDTKYFDVAERALFNGVLSGIGLDGEHFFYDNVLESDGDKTRSPWFTTSCCPTQISRFLPTISNYLYMQNNDTIFLNTYASSQCEVSIDGQSVTLVQHSNYPYDGRIEITLLTNEPIVATLCLRIPDWCESYHISTKFTLTSSKFKNGYLTLKREWRDGDSLCLSLNMPVRINRSHECVGENQGKVALSRGPLVYCLEECDNPYYENASAGGSTQFELEDMLIRDTGTKRICWNNEQGDRMCAIPYHLWNNRSVCRMKVWFNEEI